MMTAVSAASGPVNGESACMKILMGIRPAAVAGDDAGPASPRLEPARELQQLEDGGLPERIFRDRVAALADKKQVYPEEVQGRIACLQCWAQPSERDDDFLRAVQFADQGLGPPGARATGSPRPACLPVAVTTGSCSATWLRPGRTTTRP